MYLQVLQTGMYTTTGSLLPRACCLHSSVSSFQSVKIPWNICQYIHGKGPSYFLLPLLFHCQALSEPRRDVSLSICVSPCLHFHQDTRNTYCSLLQAPLCPEGREGGELFKSKSSHKHDAASETEPLLPAAAKGKAIAHRAPLAARGLGGSGTLCVTPVEELLSGFSTVRAVD